MITFGGRFSISFNIIALLSLLIATFLLCLNKRQSSVGKWLGILALFSLLGSVLAMIYMIFGISGLGGGCKILRSVVRNNTTLLNELGASELIRNTITNCVRSDSPGDIVEPRLPSTMSKILYKDFRDLL